MNKCSKCGAVYDGAEIFCPKDGTRLGGAREIRKMGPSSIPPASDPMVGKVIQGRYRIIRPLGEGGMGVVYVAEHVEIEKKVALKVLREDFSKRPEVVERFRQEAKSASKIGHAHIVDVTDFGQLDNGGVYFVMEYLKGLSLSDIIAEGPVPLEKTANIVRQIAKALQAAHNLGIVHRDLKPENVFLVAREENDTFVKILDFGIAKISDRDSEGKRLTKTGMIFGTPEYMSPEQAAGRPLDHRVDVYALGCIMFEMFTGTVPFDGDTFMAILTQHMFEPVPMIEDFNPGTDAPVSVRNVVYKAMAKDADERYPDMTALEHDLERALTDAGYIVEAPRTEQSVRLAVNGLRSGAQTVEENLKETLVEWIPTGNRFGRNKKSIQLAIAVAIGVILLGILGFYLLSSDETPKDENIEGEIEDIGKTLPKPEEGQTGAVSLTKGETETPPTPPVENHTNAKSAEVGGDTKVAKRENLINVIVTTEPPEGVISVKGMGQVCSSAPCEIELVEGTPVEIEANLGKRHAEQTFTPSVQNKELVLKLKKPERRASRRNRGKEDVPSKEQGAEKKPAKGSQKTGELKIPGIFLEN